MKKIQKLLLLLLMMAMLLPTFAMAETPVIVNLVEDPDAEYHFEDGAKILEIVFRACTPPTASSCAMTAWS